MSQCVESAITPGEVLHWLGALMLFTSAIIFVAAWIIDRRNAGSTARSSRLRGSPSAERSIPPARAREGAAPYVSNPGSRRSP